MTDAMIRIEGLGHRFGGTPILHDINATVGHGVLCAVAGANGCGKTTLLRCICGLLHPTEGRVSIAGRSVEEYSARELAQTVSFVRQHHATDVDFSAFEIVQMGRNPYQSRLQNESQADWDIVEQCMKQTGTWHLRFARPGRLSGGELQRVMIARALAQQTPIMLLDEPTSSLDIAHQFEVMELLRRIVAEEHKSVVIVMHDLNLILQYCDEVILLHQGSILYHGGVDEGLSPERVAEVYGIEAMRHSVEGRPHLFFSKLSR